MNKRGSAHTPFAHRNGDGWAVYSQKKNEWIRTHPSATHKEIDRAAKRIAKELGL